MCRVTVNGKISQFSCKLDVEEKLWNVQSGKMSGKSLASQEANRMLDKIRVGVTKAYQEICDKDKVRWHPKSHCSAIIFRLRLRFPVIGT